MVAACPTAAPQRSLISQDRLMRWRSSFMGGGKGERYSSRGCSGTRRRGSIASAPMNPSQEPLAADAETTAQFLLDRVRAARGPMWDQGARPVAGDPPGAALRVFATRRVRGIPEVVA